MSVFEQVAFVAACVSSAAFVIKAVLMMLGLGVDVPDGDATPDVPAEVDSDGLSFFSLHGIMAFFAVGGWGVLLGYGMTGSYALSLLMGVLAGALTMVACSYLMRALMRLQQSGNVSVVKAVGKVGDVYLRIPPMGEGMGKITLELGGKEGEYRAISMDNTEIPYGTRVRVVDLRDDEVMVVQRESEEYI